MKCPRVRRCSVVEPLELLAVATTADRRRALTGRASIPSGRCRTRDFNDSRSRQGSYGGCHDRRRGAGVCPRQEPRMAAIEREPEPVSRKFRPAVDAADVLPPVMRARRRRVPRTHPRRATRRGRRRLPRRTTGRAHRRPARHRPRSPGPRRAVTAIAAYLGVGPLHPLPRTTTRRSRLTSDPAKITLSATFPSDSPQAPGAGRRASR
jgi:hypothetical protein